MLLELGQRPLRHRHDARRRSGTATDLRERRARSSRAFGGVAEPSQANSAPVPARTPTPRCDEVFWYSYCLVAGGDAPATSKTEALWYHRLRRAAATSGVPSMRPKRRIATFWHHYRSLRVARWRRTRPRDDLCYLDRWPCDYSPNAASPRRTRAARRPDGLSRRPGRRSACYGYVGPLVGFTVFGGQPWPRERHLSRRRDAWRCCGDPTSSWRAARRDGTEASSTTVPPPRSRPTGPLNGTYAVEATCHSCGTSLLTAPGGAASATPMSGSFVASTPLAVRRDPELGLYAVEATVGDVEHGVPSRTIERESTRLSRAGIEVVTSPDLATSLLMMMIVMILQTKGLPLHLIH